MFRRASIPLPLANFGLELLEAKAEGCGLSVATFMEQAAARYVAEPDREAPSRRVPDFLQGHTAWLREHTVEVELSPDLWSALEREADAQGVSVELIVAHVAMLAAAATS
jgi:hypothetical protein